MVHAINIYYYILPKINKAKYLRTACNGSQLKNPDISGALYTLRIQYWYTQAQCEDGAIESQGSLIDSRYKRIEKMCLFLKPF